METTAALMSGSRVGNYILEDPIGHGAFAEVWKAHHHERPQRVVAVKFAVEPKFRKQLQREARLPEIDHPNVVPILDSDTRFAESPYVVMPYLTGGSLAELIGKHTNGLPEHRVEALLKDILSGLAEAHRRGIVHRDIKPSNILLDGNGRALIADFGLSANDATTDFARSMVQSASLSSEGIRSVAGSYAYMAQEVLDATTVTPAADVYSIGVVLFEMLTGRRPHGLELPSQAREDLADAAYWDGLFYWACCRVPERYANAIALKAAADGTPDPTPFAALTEEPDPLPHVAVAPLPSEAWEGVALRWQEREATRKALEDTKVERDAALTIYAESHPHLRALQLQVRSADSEYRAADGRLRDVCAKVASKLSDELSPLARRRELLLAKGLLPAHPEIQTIDRQLAPVPLAIARTLPDLDPSQPAVQALMAWLKASQDNSIDAYDAFLETFGTAPQNPWVSLGMNRRASLIKRQFRNVLLVCFTGLLLFVVFVVAVANFHSSSGSSTVIKSDKEQTAHMASVATPGQWELCWAKHSGNVGINPAIRALCLSVEHLDMEGPILTIETIRKEGLISSFVWDQRKEPKGVWYNDLKHTKKGGTWVLQKVSPTQWAGYVTDTKGEESTMILRQQ